jgi:RNA polymerase sigma factor (TIGR02999 family)
MSSPDTLSLLRASRTGDQSVIDGLFSQMYPELRAIAHRQLRAFRPGDTLNTTAVVHEAYMKLVDQGRAEPNDRAHFLALASRAMRFVVVDYARARSRAKRGGNAEQVILDAAEIAGAERAEDLLALDEALTRLGELDARLAAVVEYRFFGGLEHQEIAQVTGRSVPTIKRDWTRARTWLYREMRGDREPGSA